MNIHPLGGCSPVPLAYYLKALGILRIIAQQIDPQVRGWWDGERFVLATSLSRDELIDFFLRDYKPTPFVSPWNRGSGFYKKNDPGLSPLQTSSSPRFTVYRRAIDEAWKRLDALSEADRAVRAIKGESKGRHLSRSQRTEFRASAEYRGRLSEAEREFKRLKAEFIPRLRLAWRGPHREWMDAAMVLDDGGTAKYPALLGTGGSDGRLDFTNNFMQRLGDLFDLSSAGGDPKPSAREWFNGAIWGAPIAGCQIGKAVGQYLPGMAGGANSTNGPKGDSLLNPADFILMMEGTLLFSAHTTRRLGISETSRAAAPFAVNAYGAGFMSGSVADESARGEQWMPLWFQPVTFGELNHLFAEGRMQLGSKPAREPLDVARAVVRLGTARGIEAFERFGYIERNGQSNLAVPLGRFRVPDKIAPSLACIDDLDTWLQRLRRSARKNNASTGLRNMEQRLGEALFAVIQHPDEPLRWQTVLALMAQTEGIMITGQGVEAGPVPDLRPEWVSAADDGSPEFRLALSFALQGWKYDKTRGMPADPIRRHWVPIKGRGFDKSAVTDGKNAALRVGRVLPAGVLNTRGRDVIR